MGGWHPTQERAKQAARTWLSSLSETSHQEAYREIRQSQGHVKAHVLKEDEGFQETFFLALGLGLGLVAILLLVFIISTPQFASRARSFVRSLFTSKNKDQDLGSTGILKARTSDPQPAPVSFAKLAMTV